MLRCIKCSLEKPDDCFALRDRTKQTRHSTCKECFKLYRHKHYQDNLSKYKSSAASSKKKMIARNREHVIEYLKNNHCIQCNESDVVVLQFDHRCPKTKVDAVANLVQNAVCISRLQEEIDKCDVLCANCHVRRTAKQFSWHKQ